MDERDKLLIRLAESTRTPRGKFSAEQSWPLLAKRLQPNRRSLSWYRWAGTCAAVILLLLGGAYLCKSFFTEEMCTLSTEASVREVVLPDSSTVVLNRYTTLSYPVKFREKREVYLQGGAYFEVRKDAGHPFHVAAGAVDIQVLGTHFEVEAYPADTQISTTLLEGSVAVSTPYDKRILSPNERAIYHRSTCRLITQADVSPDKVAWRKGEFRFEQVPLGEVFRQLSNAFHIDIQIQDSRLKDYRVRARFTQNESLEEILHLLQDVAPFAYHRQENRIVITQE